MSGLLLILRRMNLRHVRARKLRTILTTTGIAAGVALAFSISVINATLISSFRSSIRTVAGAAELEVAAATPEGLPERVVREVEAFDGVADAVPAVRVNTEIRGNAGSDRTLILGITPRFSSLFPDTSGPLARVQVTGGFGGDGRGLLLSRTASRSIGARRGDRVAVSTPAGMEGVPVTGTIGGGAIAVVNGGNVGMMLLPAAQSTFGKEGRVDSIYVVVDPDAPLARVEAGLRTVAPGAVVGPPGERGQGLERVFAGLGSLLSLAGTVALFVAMFVVYNTMSMSLVERRREISMALAFGAARRHVFGAFLLEAAALGAIASAAGIVAGFGLARVLVDVAVQGLSVFPVATGGPIAVSPGHVATAAGAGIAVSVLGALVPARRVLRVAPIESLRPDAPYEWTHASSFGISHRLTLSIAVAGLAMSFVAMVLTTLYPHAEWLVLAGAVTGMTGVTFLLPYIVPFAVGVIRPFLTRGFGAVGRIASDALAKNPGRTTFTVAALVLTIGMTTGVGAAVTSYQRQVDRLASAIIGAPIYVTSTSYTGLASDQPLSGDLGPALERVEGVDSVYPIRSTLINIGDQQGVLFAVPVAEAIEHGATTDLTAMTADPEAFLDALGAGDIAVSRHTAEQHGLAIGDSFDLPTPEGPRSFTVGATYEELVSFDSIYIDHDTYVRIWGDDKVDQYGALLEPGVSVATVEDRLNRLIDERGIAARTYTKEQLVGRLLEIVEGTFSLGRGIQAAALVVALLTIANTMFTAVYERRWETGLQRALGMRAGELSRAVLLEAGAIGIIGGIGGAILGTAIGYLMLASMELQFAWEIPFQPPVMLAAIAIAGATLLAAAAGFLPSRLAVRAPIIEALRYE